MYENFRFEYIETKIKIWSIVWAKINGIEKKKLKWCEANKSCECVLYISCNFPLLPNLLWL